MSGAGEDFVTPELALVDPELAEAERQIPERKAAMSSEPSNGTFFVDPAQPEPAPLASEPPQVRPPAPVAAPAPAAPALGVDSGSTPMLDVPLGTLIFRAGLLAEEQLEDALQEGMRTGKRLGEVLLERGWLHERDLGRLLAGQKGLPFVEVSASDSDPAALQVLPEEKARLQVTLPLRYEEGQLVVAVADPSNELVLENLRRTLGAEPQLVVAAHTDLLRAIGEAYASLHGQPAAASQAPEPGHEREDEPAQALAPPTPLPTVVPPAEERVAEPGEAPALQPPVAEPAAHAVEEQPMVAQPAPPVEEPPAPQLETSAVEVQSVPPVEHVPAPELETPAVEVQPAPPVEEAPAPQLETPPVEVQPAPPLEQAPAPQLETPGVQFQPAPPVEEAPAPPPEAPALQPEPPIAVEPAVPPLLQPPEASPETPETPEPAMPVEPPVQSFEAQPLSDPVQQPPLLAPPPVEQPAETPPEPLLQQPAPAPVQEFSPPQPATEEPAEDSGDMHIVLLRLREGDMLEVGTFPTAAEASARAQEVVAQIASAEGAATWPFFAERYLRPDTIVSVDLVEQTPDKWMGSSARRSWATKS